MNVTPGMWRVDERPSVRGGRMVMDTKTGNVCVADVYGWLGNMDEAAALVAAAPDLLHAARQALGTMEWAQDNVPGTNLLSDIALLKRAVALADNESVAGDE